MGVDNKELSGGITIDFPHHEIHDGNTYQATVFVDTLTQAALSIAFKVPAGTKEAHAVVEWYSESKGYFEILETATWDNTSGTQVTIFNARRNSANTSQMQDDKAGAFAANMKVLQDVTTPAGTAIDTIWSWATKVQGGVRDRTSSEIILKNDTQYILRITSDDGNKGMGMKIRWYEHTP